MPKHLTLLQRQKIHVAFLDGEGDNQRTVSIVLSSRFVSIERVSKQQEGYFQKANLR